MNHQQHINSLRGKSGPMGDRRTKKLRDRQAKKRDAIRRSKDES